jgi:hypothetical protein
VTTRIVQDFQWYYNDSYIGYKETPDGPVLPFYVECIEWVGVRPTWDGGDWYDDSDGEDSREEYEARDQWFESDEYNDYSEEAYGNIVFRGHFIATAQGDTRSLCVQGFHNPQLEFKNPLLGFMKESRRHRTKSWVTYVAGRSVKKGLASNRISHNLTSYMAWQAYATFDGTGADRDFWHNPSTGLIHYRHNTVVATKDRDCDLIYLDPLMSHITTSLQERFPTCQIIPTEL